MPVVLIEDGFYPGALCFLKDVAVGAVIVSGDAQDTPQALLAEPLQCLEVAVVRCPSLRGRERARREKAVF